MKEKVIFISNFKFIDSSFPEGGVSQCTNDFISLLSVNFEVLKFPVKLKSSYFYKLEVKLGLNVYTDYKVEDYEQSLKKIIKEHNVKNVFLNLTNTAEFSVLIKRLFGQKVKVILCSHGNESGDYLHEITTHGNNKPFYQVIISTYILGKMLKKEAIYRQKYIDLILTVSEIEQSIENWIGAKKVLMIPRSIFLENIDWNPILGVCGFVGDLSHLPNSFGIDQLCNAILKYEYSNIEIRLVGSSRNIAQSFEMKYPFVKYIGYLTNEELKKEVSQWSFFLNPVFYYSRGVSTKLAKALSWYLPVITTKIGCRGYEWEIGNPIFANSVIQMAEIIIESANNREIIYKAKKSITDMANSIPSLNTISGRLINSLASD